MGFLHLKGLPVNHDSLFFSPESADLCGDNKMSRFCAALTWHFYGLINKVVGAARNSENIPRAEVAS